jgi:hypothetical protein
MANVTELSARLLKRFKNVPNVTAEDAYDWTEESMLVHGYTSADNVPSDKELLLLLYAQAEGALQISLGSAHFFSYSDGDEQVDKTMVSEQYRKLAKDLREEYALKRATDSSRVVFMKRVDR